MLDIIKKQSVGTWIALGTLLLTIVSAIVYGANVGGAGYFNSAGVSEVVIFSVLTIVFLAAIIVIPQFEYTGIVKTVVSVALDVLKIFTAIFLILALVYLVNGRIEGLAYIYFSNEDIIATIQTPENLASASGAITSFVFYGITWLAAAVGAFFAFKKKNA